MRPQRAIALGALLLAAGWLAAADTKTTEKAADDAKKLKGTWAVVSAEAKGKAEDNLKELTFTFDGDKLTVKTPRGDKEGTFKLDPKKKPKEITITPKDDKDKGDLLGIYEFDKDGNLKLCMTDAGGKERPKEYVTKEDDKVILFVLKKEKK